MCWRRLSCALPLSLFSLFSLFFPQFISRRHRVSPQKPWAAGGAAINKTARLPAVRRCYPLFWRQGRNCSRRHRHRFLVRISNMEGRSGPAGTAAPFLGGLGGWRIIRSDSNRNIILIMSYKKIVKC
jgi:hypothetical protein